MSLSEVNLEIHPKGVIDTVDILHSPLQNLSISTFTWNIFMSGIMFLGDGILHTFLWLAWCYKLTIDADFDYDGFHSEMAGIAHEWYDDAEHLNDAKD